MTLELTVTDEALRDAHTARKSEETKLDIRRMVKQQPKEEMHAR